MVYERSYNGPVSSFFGVLILVILDYGLRDKRGIWYGSIGKSLNPCYSGLWSTRGKFVKCWYLDNSVVKLTKNNGPLIKNSSFCHKIKQSCQRTQVINKDTNNLEEKGVFILCNDINVDILANDFHGLQVVCWNGNQKNAVVIVVERLNLSQILLDFAEFLCA